LLVAWALMKAAIRSFGSLIRLKPPWLPGTMATCACGEAAAGAGLLRGKQGAAHAGDQQGGHGNRAEFVVGEDGEGLGSAR
jgi:hypothetical protein